MRSIAQFLLALLLNASWQIVLVVMFASLCALILRGASAWQRHAVWVAALVLSFWLPVLSSAKIFPPVMTDADEPPAVATQTASISLSETVTAASENASATVAELPVEIPTVPVSRNSPASAVHINEKLAVSLLAAYLLFGLYRAFKLFRAWRRTKAIVRSAYPLPIPDQVQLILARCQNVLGVTRLRILFSEALAVPVTAGVFHPAIILPKQLLCEQDADVLCSALGHELVHVARRDYLLNLLYELLYLPLAFHPAAALLRRRVRESRELCCDEMVAGKLMRPEVYARSLVRLIGSAPLAGRLAADTTIGITDANILEVRIMSLLKQSKLSARRRGWLLVAASLLLAIPCLAAASFAFNFDLAERASAATQNQEPQAQANQDLQRARQDLEKKAQELRERVQKNPNPQGEEQRQLRRMEVELKAAAAKLGAIDHEHQLKDAEQKIREAQERLAQVEEKYPQNEAHMREAQEKLAELQRLFPENDKAHSELRARLNEIVTKYPNMTVTAGVRERLQRYLLELDQANGRLSTTQEKKEEKLKEKERKEEMKERSIEAKEERELKERDEQEARSKSTELELRKRKQPFENREERMRNKQLELARGAAISMDRAIQVATSQYPGTFLGLHCSLERDGEGRVLYHVIILNSEGEKGSTRHVWVSALDGQIIKTQKE
jgi:beta-lactamase regulating signal transducer with metallopeptidase domain